MLSRDEFRRLLEAMPEYWRPLLELLVASGSRWGEATALKPGDVDQTAGTSASAAHGNTAPKVTRSDPQKTKRSRRTINLPPTLLEKLDYRHDWLFTDGDAEPVRYHKFRPIWDKAVKKAQLDPAPTPHDLRHTCASWMLAAGIPITTVSRHLGHESIKITADIYADIERASFAQAAQVMSELLKPLNTPAMLEPDCAPVESLP